MRERLTELSCEEFSDRLASRDSVPGGGGGAALAGALAVALCSMAASLTVDKPRFADAADELHSILEDADDVRFRLLDLVDDDASGFLPLLDAYALPATDAARPERIREATKGACMAPLAMMGECCRAVVLLERVADVCMRSMRSDVACGAVLAAAALEAASINVRVNTAALPADDETAVSIEGMRAEMLDEFVSRARALAARLAPESVRSGYGRDAQEDGSPNA